MDPPAAALFGGPPLDVFRSTTSILPEEARIKTLAAKMITVFFTILLASSRTLQFHSAFIQGDRHFVLDEMAVSTARAATRSKSK